jgi:hypothetical protein
MLVKTGVHAGKLCVRHLAFDNSDGMHLILCRLTFADDKLRTAYQPRIVYNKGNHEFDMGLDVVSQTH